MATTVDQNERAETLIAGWRALGPLPPATNLVAQSLQPPTITPDATSRRAAPGLTQLLIRYSLAGTLSTTIAVACIAYTVHEVWRLSAPPADSPSHDSPGN